MSLASFAVTSVLTTAALAQEAKASGAPAAAAPAPTAATTAPTTATTAPAAATPPPAAPTAAPVAARKKANATIDVEVEADHEEAGLYRIVATERAGLDANLNGTLGSLNRRERLCTVPCRLSVPPGDYLIGGQRLRQSPVFSLTGQSRSVRIDAEVGTDGAMLGGIVLSGLGGFTLLVSMPILIVGGVVAGEDKGSGLLVGGGIAAAAGAGLLVGGLSMIIGSKTTVSLQPR